MTQEQVLRLSPYTMSQPPTSPGRALLSRAYLHYCGLQWGYSGHDLAAAFDERAGRGIFGQVALSTRLFGELLARGDIRSWARPFGGGVPTPLKPSTWELDDFVDRFATSAINLVMPFDLNGLSHWIFVDLDSWNRVVDDLLGVSSRGTSPDPLARRAGPPERASRDLAPGGVDDNVDAGRLMRLPEVIRRTSLSKPTIYRRMKAGRFPRQNQLDGNMSVWREEEIAAWLADPK